MIRNYRELAVYQKAFEQAMRISELTKRFPADRQDAGCEDSIPREVLLHGATHRLMTNCRSLSRASCTLLRPCAPRTASSFLVPKHSASCQLPAVLDSSPHHALRALRRVPSAFFVLSTLPAACCQLPA